MEKTVIKRANKAMVTVAALCLLSASAGAAETQRVAEAGRAQLMYENHCTTCHESTVHVRARRAGSRQELQGWVRRWQKVLSLEWPEQDVLAVTEYLARTYYDFAD